MSYEAIRERLTSGDGAGGKTFTENEKLLLEALQQLTTVLESDLAQIKVALGHVARLIEQRRE